ncbi:MAG: acyl-CoA carboxylase subunit beta [Treponema sp.]|nr:acyl-CoA carboxylase subunit beta [Candidatus Treponema equifaecale]
MAFEYNLEKQHAKGKLHAIERINLLCDKDSFMEIYAGARHQCTNFGMDKKDLPYDGVITGFGTINGRKVGIYSQDFTVQGGSLGKVHGQKIAELIAKAIEFKCPVIGVNDSGGARIPEGVDALCGYGDIFYQNVRASGVIPQISIIAGPCAGGAVYSPGLTDFIFTVDKISQMFITGPKVVKQVMFMDISEEDLGGAAIHSQKSGVAHYRCENENECYEKVRKLLEYIPHFYGDTTPFNGTTTKNGLFGSKEVENFKFSNKKIEEIKSVLPEDSKKGYDIRNVINAVVDDDSFFESEAEFAGNAVTGFAKVEGKTIGIVANNPGFFGGLLNCDASDKIARHVRYCDCYNIPLLNFVDVPGFLPGPQEEQKGIIRHGAKVLYAYSEASVPKITVITRKAYGGAYIAMCSKHLGADFVYAWPKAEIAVMGAEGATGILFAKEMKDPANAALVEQKKAEYAATFMTPNIAAQRDYISAVINPEETRARVVQSLRLLENKASTDVLSRKHGNIPL